MNKNPPSSRAKKSFARTPVEGSRRFALLVAMMIPNGRRAGEGAAKRRAKGWERSMNDERPVVTENNKDQDQGRRHRTQRPIRRHHRLGAGGHRLHHHLHRGEVKKRRCRRSLPGSKATWYAYRARQCDGNLRMKFLVRRLAPSLWILHGENSRCGSGRGRRLFRRAAAAGGAGRDLSRPATSRRVARPARTDDPKPLRQFSPAGPAARARAGSG